ncbi:carbohydrate-binding family 9-like protein [Dinghuibacter silviterrae]|uniref:Carbohydrate binding protein with CBM9 domain n=1 Tax=Dinghuibacter silviterrae TaxID=1539049 RepID=A0A4R8DFP0_9BACT|nr:carbohydrate-binding family 9-like protein [Dinghuibacter silviterrae]TDW95760.1 carbohydrate binding protein with CBM9 domain [Dinghuibacter silviterrae]
MKPLFFLLLLSALRATAQDDSALLTRLTRMPLHYVVQKTSVPPHIDGRLDDAAWQTAPWTGDFSDIEGDIRPRPRFRTRAKMLWDEHYLYIAAQLEEPDVWATLNHHDDIIFHDNDFEVFVNPDNNARHYFEMEINALGTLFDLYLPEPYRVGGNALISWDATGLQKAVHIDGTLNHPGDTDRGWTVEMAVPIAAISMGNGTETPAPGSLWRINFSRVEWDTDVQDGHYVKRQNVPEHNWVWSPQGVINMHFPERWGYLLFADHDTAFTLPFSESLKNRLWEVAYREMMYHGTHGTYTDAAGLGLAAESAIDGHSTALTIEATAHTFIAMLTAPDTHETWTIDPNGNIGRQH